MITKLPWRRLPLGGIAPQLFDRGGGGDRPHRVDTPPTRRLQYVAWCTRFIYLPALAGSNVHCLATAVGTGCNKLDRPRFLPQKLQASGLCN